MIDLNNIRRMFGEYIVENPEAKWRIDSAFIHVIEHVYKQAIADADLNAPWLTAAHMLCTDAGVEPGHITDRLEQLRAMVVPDGAGIQHALLEEMAGAISLADGMPEAMTHPAIKRARAILAKWEASK